MFAPPEDTVAISVQQMLSVKRSHICVLGGHLVASLSEVSFMYVGLHLELRLGVCGSVPPLRYATTADEREKVRGPQFEKPACLPLGGAPELCEPLLRAMGSLLYPVRHDVSTKGFSSEGSINIDIRLMVRKLCSEPEDMKNEARNSGRAAVRPHK
jgi:hypothetical protein